MRKNSAKTLFQSFLQAATVSSSGMGGDVHSDVANPAFPLPTVVSTGQHFQNHPHSLGTPIGALKDGFEKAVVIMECFLRDFLQE